MSEPDVIQDDHIYENAYRRLVGAAIAFGRATEHLGMSEVLAEEYPDRPDLRQPHPVQVQESIIVELWDEYRRRWDEADAASDGFPDELTADDRMTEVRQDLHLAAVTLADVIDHLFAQPPPEDEDEGEEAPIDLDPEPEAVVGLSKQQLYDVRNAIGETSAPIKSGRLEALAEGYARIVIDGFEDRPVQQQVLEP